MAAKDNNVPFYAAVPVSTIDLSLEKGIGNIPIEERSSVEVSHFYGVDSSNVLSSVQICEDNTNIKNFAFDVTPAELVTAIITEKGVFEATEASLKNLLD